MMPNALRDLVRRRRIELRLTQEEVSERAGMSQEWASGVERGKIKYPRRSSLVKLADALELPREEVIVAAGFAPTEGDARTLLDKYEAPLPPDVMDMLRAIEWDDDRITALRSVLALIAKPEISPSAARTSDAAPPEVAPSPHPAEP